MMRDQARLEQSLDGLEGEVVATILDVTSPPAMLVSFLSIIEEVG